jgi:glucokinase
VTAAAYPRLLGDIGGTHIRFGWVRAPGDGVVDREVFRWPEGAGLRDALAAYLAKRGPQRPASCALAVAAPVGGDSVALTNRSDSFSIAALESELGLTRLVILNDFAALALAVPRLGPDDSRAVGGGDRTASGPIALLGPGTGLGVAASIVTPAGRCCVASEGGHASLSSHDAHEDRLLAVLRQEFGHVSFERVLSGAGIVNLYRAHCALEGVAPAPHDAAAISRLAAEAADARCVAAIDQFFAFLGSFAGNLALTFDARGGVYLGGGIVPKLIDRIGTSRFRERFEAKGRFRARLERIATRVIVDPSAAALLGANQALDDAPRS